MNIIIKNFLQKTLSLVLLFALLLPFALKFEHIFQDHHHSICKSKIESHIHQLNDDCDFLNYTINSANTENSLVFETKVDVLFAEKNYPYSTAFFTSEKATSFLRGPPSLL